MTCTVCNRTNAGGNPFCMSCGSRLAVPIILNTAAAPALAYAHPVAAPPPFIYVAPPRPQTDRYANFFLRFIAWLFDALFAGFFAGFVYGFFAAFGNTFFIVLGLLLAIATYVCYFVKQETGPYQATFGKRLVGIKITNLSGGPITAAQSFGRLCVKVLISGIFCLGYLIAAFSNRRQALHDAAANTLVVTK